MHTVLRHPSARRRYYLDLHLDRYIARFRPTAASRWRLLLRTVLDQQPADWWLQSSDFADGYEHHLNLSYSFQFLLFAGLLWPDRRGWIRQSSRCVMHVAALGHVYDFEMQIKGTVPLLIGHHYGSDPIPFGCDILRFFVRSHDIYFN